MKLEERDEIFKETALELISALTLGIIFLIFLALLTGLGINCVTLLLS